MEVDDSSQQAMVEWNGATALLLAGPGCGKTHILARRVFHANAVLGVPFEKMLCVTFTNRAAREMKSRIERHLGERPQRLFVGNMHRFCMSFLYENGLMDPDTDVLEEEDQLQFLASLGIMRSADVKEFLLQCAYVYQRSHDHPESITRRPRFMPTQADMDRIETYARFKADNALIDFDDILLRAYTALAEHPAANLKLTGYTWIQVDEVQDMTPLQLALIDRLSTDSPQRTCLFLGDEQQAIFSFTGAGGRALDMLRRMCRDNIFFLRRNYRSPRCLVELCNDLSATWLSGDAARRPNAVSDNSCTDQLVAYSSSAGNLRLVAASLARRMLAENPDETVAILTRTNGEGDDVSYVLSCLGLEHFHISKNDVFHQLPFKTIWAHLAATGMPLHRHAWPRLLYQTGATRTLHAARELVARMFSAGVEPAMLVYPWRKPAIVRFIDALDSACDIVIVDTETTGIDIFCDNIIQIAAMKIKGSDLRDGILTDARFFEVFVESDRPVPRYLDGDIENPLYEIYPEAVKCSPEEALTRFAAFAGKDAIIAGHNVDFDLRMLRRAFERHCIDGRLSAALDEESLPLDTLILSRLLFPALRSHRLADLIAPLHLNGVNSHNATDDVTVTASLITVLASAAKMRISYAMNLIQDKEFIAVSQRFTNYYGSFYKEARKRLDVPGTTVAGEMRATHDFLAVTGAIERIHHLDYILRLVDDFITDKDSEPSLRVQLGAHLFDLLAYHESDLYANGLIDERLSVTTIHKAKGLEADNVIFYDATRSTGNDEDRARLLYVAFSRARKRLAVGMSRQPDTILMSVLRHFRQMSHREIWAAVNSEAKNLCEDAETHIFI